MENTVHFILTGGTIDSFYNGSKDTVEPFAESVIPEYIKSLKLFETVEFTTVCMKDSRDLNSQDRLEMLKVVEKSPRNKIIITHGTYTMPDSARYLKENLTKQDKTIIFTGSMIPLVGFSPTDASFNLGYSIARVMELGPGIKVCMNGKTFNPEEVVKIVAEGRFDSIYNHPH